MSGENWIIESGSKMERIFLRVLVLIRAILCRFVLRSLLLRSAILGVLALFSFQALTTEAPTLAARETVQALNQLQWMEREEGFNVLRAVTQSGIVLTAYRISPDRFTVEMEVQENRGGSRVRDIAEESGAVLAVNGGFFAVGNNNLIYSVGYLRKNGHTFSKGWSKQGGLIQFTRDGLKLSPSHAGIPINNNDILQSRPMILEPGGVWAMSGDNGIAKLRSLLCTLPNGDVVIVVISRVGLSIYEAGWLLRRPEDGGFFGCDAAVALDGGRSTQVWDSDEPSYSYSGLSNVHNFLVVRSKR